MHTARNLLSFSSALWSKATCILRFLPVRAAAASTIKLKTTYGRSARKKVSAESENLAQRKRF